MAYPFLLFLSLFPIFLIGFVVYIIDKEKESLKSVIGFYLFGLFAAYMSNVVENLFYFKGDSLIVIFLDSFLCVALVEECAKLLCVHIGLNFNKSYNNFFDSIVFCSAVSLGFAAIENILYVFNTSSTSISTGISTGLLRAFLAVPAHAIFSIYMGYFLDRYREHKFSNVGGAGAYMALALIVPITLHGFYDFFCLSMGVLNSMTFFVMFVVYVIFMYVSGIVLLVKGSRKSHIRFDGGSDNGHVYRCVFCGSVLEYTVCSKCGGNNTEFVEATNKYYSLYGKYPEMPEGQFKICHNCGNFAQGYFCNKCGKVL